MKKVKILPGFWHSRLDVNSSRAIFHQWEQINATGCIENFRIVTGESDGFRLGLFFADSDAYKWLEAASRIWASTQEAKLLALIDGLIDLIGRAQDLDGYLFTYNQIHFPGSRWHNLQVEHELYCHGHLIEAGVTHYHATGRTDLLTIARRAADRIVTDFQGKGPSYTPGHEEIELALLRLHQVTPGDTAYVILARQFIEKRGRARGFGWVVFRQWLNTFQRMITIQKQAGRYAKVHPGFKLPPVMPDNYAKGPGNAMYRWIGEILNGEYNQQHRPVIEQTEPTGHSVRFGYLETAVTMLARESNDMTFFPAVKQAWNHMVERRMYVTGGLGSLPQLEGFGKDYELDPEYAYTETCAALACMFWNWELAQLTGEARYSDLFEWQLYNAAGVGMGLQGDTYFYNNPLCSREIIRKPWYAVPCCPPNISRTWASLDRYLYSTEPAALLVHQYVNSELIGETIGLPDGQAIRMHLKMNTDLPGDGCAQLQIIEVTPSRPGQLTPFEIRLRYPSWATQMTIRVNNSILFNDELRLSAGNAREHEATASGYDPRQASFVSINRGWTEGDTIDIRFEMPVETRTAHPNVKGHQGKFAVTRGPLVYCLESLDNPGIDIFTERLDPDSIVPEYDPFMLGGTVKLLGKTRKGKSVILIPYYLWGNRGPSQMTVWVNI